MFLMVHLTVNFSAINGEEAYNKAASFMGNIPFNMFLAIALIFVPILFHGIYGVIICRDAKNNVSTYRYEKNWYFYFQRLSGIIAFLFMIWHVATTTVQAWLGAEVNFDMVANLVDNPIYLIFYIVGIVAATFHLGNGIRTMLITWGITASKQSQRLGKWIGFIVFVVFTAIGLTAIFAFV